MTGTGRAAEMGCLSLYLSCTETRCRCFCFAFQIYPCLGLHIELPNSDTPVDRIYVNNSPTSNSPTFESRSKKGRVELQLLKPDYTICILPTSFYPCKNSEWNGKGRTLNTFYVCIVSRFRNPRTFFPLNNLIFSSFAFMDWKYWCLTKKSHHYKLHFGFNKIKIKSIWHMK